MFPAVSLRPRVRPRAGVAAALFAYLLFFRIRGVADSFWMLGDQIRDWSIALGPLRDLPLTGTPSSVGGTSLGPVFYWTLWAIRCAIGPFTDNLPHAGAIGLAVAQSAADAFLFVVLARRFGSLLFALATTLFVATAPYDVAITATMWNPSLSVALVKVAIGLALLAGDRPSIWWSVGITAVAWLAVQSHSSAIFAAAPIVGALVVRDLGRRDWMRAAQRTRAVVETVAVLQLPLLLALVRHRDAAVAPSTVMSSVSHTLQHPGALRVGDSFGALSAAASYVLLNPLPVPWLPGILFACAIVAAIRLRRDLAAASVSVLPLACVVAGFSFWQQAFDHYWYLTAMPSLALTIGLALTAWAPARRPVVLVLSLAIVAAQGRRHDVAMGIHRMPAYDALVRGSRQVLAHTRQVRQIHTEFPLDSTSDPTFLYRILGGEISPDSRLVAVIGPSGSVTFHEALP